MNRRTLEAPCDMWAEENVAACAVATPAGQRATGRHVTADDFYRRDLARLYAAAGDLPDTTDEDARVEAAAALCGWQPAAIRTLLEQRAVMWDLNGGFARRVAQTARRRRLMQHAGALYDALGTGEPDEQINRILAQLYANAQAAA